jgi:hypothetical protein
MYRWNWHRITACLCGALTPSTRVIVFQSFSSHLCAYIVVYFRSGCGSTDSVSDMMCEMTPFDERQHARVDDRDYDDGEHRDGDSSSVGWVEALAVDGVAVDSETGQVLLEQCSM